MNTEDLEQGAIARVLAGREVLLLGVVGSTRYGLAREGSDRDYLGAFQAPSLELLGTNPSRAVEVTITGQEPDLAVHELGKLVRLLTGANPTVTELLWLPSYTTISDAGRRLVESRQLFLSTNSVRSAYLGYATDQARRLLARTESGSAGFSSDVSNRSTKHGRHCARLLIAAEELLTTGALTLDVGARRGEIFALGELAVTDPAAFTAHFEMERARVETLPSVLPERPAYDEIESLVRSIRLDQLHTGTART